MPPSNRPLHLASLLLLTGGCTPSPPTSPEPPPPALVDVEVTVLDPATGGGLADLEVGEAASTDQSGVAEIAVEQDSPFEVRVTSSEILPHVLAGFAGTEPFEFVTFAGTGAQAEQTLAYLGLSWSEETGIVVVGIDYEDWSPVAGAGASLSDTGASAFVVTGSGMPESAATIPEGGVGIVSFANVSPGSVSVYLQPPAGTLCTPHPHPRSHESVPVYPGEVTVVLARCRPDPGQPGVR